VLARKVGLAPDHVFDQSRDTDLLAARGIEVRDLGYGRHLAQQTDRIKTPFIKRISAPRELRRPCQLTLNFLDELADSQRCRLGLLLLNSHQQNSLFVERK